jgi:serine/threonine protein kinase
MAPEVHRHEPYNQSADVYSFGVLMYEVMARTMLVFTAVGDGPAHVAKTAGEQTEGSNWGGASD